MPPYAVPVARTFSHEEDIGSDVSGLLAGPPVEAGTVHALARITITHLFPTTPHSPELLQHSSSSTGKSDYQKKNLRDRLSGSVAAIVDFLAYNGVAKSR